MRDAKTRRREDPMRRGHHEGKEGKKDKEDMVDNDFLDSLRKGAWGGCSGRDTLLTRLLCATDIGDPFAAIASIKRDAQ